MSRAETVSVEEAARRLGVSRGSAFKAAKTGELPVIRLGKRLLVPVRALEKMLGQAEGTAPASVGSIKADRDAPQMERPDGPPQT